jgi:hypothetical protein
MICRWQEVFKRKSLMLRKTLWMLLVFLGCVLGKDSKTLCHYSLKALQISQNHLRLSFYRPHANTKKQKSKKK